MTTFIEYDLGDGATILVEAPESQISGVTRVARKPGEQSLIKAKKSFVNAFKDVKAQAKLLLDEIEELQVSEAEVKFGINTIGEVGNMAIGKLGVGVNYEVTLKWSKIVNSSS